MNREGRDWIAIALAAAGVVGAISLAGIFVVYLIDSLGDDDSPKPAATAKLNRATTGPTAATGPSVADGTDGSSKSSTGKAGATGGKTGSSPAEQNKIPDDQRYTTYTSRSAGFSILVPKGWKENVRGKLIGFSSGANYVLISTGKGPAPTAKSARRQLAKNKKKFKIVDAPRETTVGGNAAVVDKVRDISRKESFLLDQYRLGKDKKIVVLNLGTPGTVSKDNADDYRRIANSFRWL